MYKIGESIRIKSDYIEYYPLIPSYGIIESIDDGWITMKNFLGVLHLPQDRIQHNIYK